MGDASSLVPVLLGHAVHSASRSVHCPFIGQAGELPSAKVDEASLHTYYNTAASGTDQ